MDDLPLTSASHHPMSALVLEAVIESHIPNATRQEIMDLIVAIQELYRRSINQL